MKSIVTALAFLVVLASSGMGGESRRMVNSELTSYINESIGMFGSIPDKRKSELAKIAHYVTQCHEQGKSAKLTFICTHNSRRSHMAQVWAQTAAAWYGIPDVKTYSGGTEATAFNPRAVRALEQAGFAIERTSESDNPVYRVRYSETAPAMEAFSKVYNQSPNPTEDYCAVMTCSDADEACPVVFGAAERISVPYKDPKEFDGTKRESEAYAERCRQISSEILYVFSLVAEAQAGQ